MARQPRIDLPGTAQHLVQRGNDRQPCFFRDIDRARYLQDLRELSLKRGPQRSCACTDDQSCASIYWLLRFNPERSAD